jgi:signal transduction histidine kinase/CheY-like chemotaxis protein/HPt (histidine-containing phosphotransfer) domain-containing protein
LIVPAVYQDAHREGLKRYRTTGEKRVVDAGRVELSAIHADGTEFPVEISISESSTGKSQMFIAYLRDISGRRAAQQQLLEARDAALAADRAKSEFLAVMSHEMRTPLNGVLGLLELLQATDLDDRQRRYVETAAFSGDVLLRHINDVLDLSRVDAGKMDYAREPLEISAIVDQVLEIGRQGVESNGNHIEKSISPGLAGLLGDSHRIRQVLLNLVGNAGKFTHQGRILVSVDALSGDEETIEVEFAVTDSGEGLPEDERQRVFEDFITLDSSFARSNTGTGLGLAICRRIIHGMGGSIGVADGFEGGSRFWFRLRLDRAKFSMIKQTPVAFDPGLANARRILIVEDNDVNRMVVGEMLRSAGHDVSEAHSGYEGIDLAEKEQFNLIIMDISMPGIDGIEATRRIRRGTSGNAETPIIGLTAHVMPEVQDTVIAAGMQTCLSKPVRRIDLLKAVTQYSNGTQNEINDKNKKNLHRPELINDEIFIDLAKNLPPKIFRDTVLKVVDQIEDLSLRLVKGVGVAEYASLAGQVHKVAGAAAMIGAAELYRQLSELEPKLRGKEVENLSVHLPDLFDCITDTKLVLKEFIDAGDAV